MHDVKKAAAAVRLLPTLLVRAARRLPPGDRLGRRLGRIWRLSVLRLVVEGALADARRLPVALVRDLPLAYGAVPHATGVEREETDKADFEPHALLRVHDRGVAAPRAHARAEVLGGLDDGRAPDCTTDASAQRRFDPCAQKTSRLLIMHAAHSDRGRPLV